MSLFDFFEIENDRVVITPNCLLIPEFKTLVEKYKNPIAALSYVQFMTHPNSPYSDYPEVEKSEIIAKDMRGDFSLDDLEMDQAVEKARELIMTPTQRFYLDAKIGLEKMGGYLRDSGISSGRDGNDTTYLSFLKSVGKITTEFKALEKAFKEETNDLRGSQESSYDED